MINKKVILWNAILFLVFGGASLVYGLTGIGLVAILFGVINLFLTVVFLITKMPDTSMACLIMGGIFLLVGFGLCSQVSFNVQ